MTSYESIDENADNATLAIDCSICDPGPVMGAIIHPDFFRAGIRGPCCCSNDIG